jgi:hypothetical protein
MILLRFRVENHRSLRDEAVLSLVQPSMTTLHPKDGDWVGATTRVAGIYGANASGKSTVVDALKFFRATVMNSAASWSLDNTLPQQPFLLDPEAKDSPSGYAVDFLLKGMRYQYGFMIDRDAVRQEWLFDYPSTKHRVLFEREGYEFKFGRALLGAPRTHASATGERELFLSKAKSNGHELLGRLWSALVDRLVIADFSEQDRGLRLDQITEEIADGVIDVHDVITLLRVADIGIANVAIEAKEPDLSEMIRTFFMVGAKERHVPGTAPALNQDRAREGASPRSHMVQRALMFQHIGQSGTFPLPLDAQSTGTLSWLSLALPALTILRRGGILVVDEIDASLHPQLSQVILRMFKDPDYNSTGAQLIFTTHDTFLLSAQSDSMLTPEETWFTEKNRDGATSLFSLADFPTRADQNFAKRYLDGRYGAVPRTARSFLATLLNAEPRETSDA